MPTPAQASAIVARLWSKREAALANLDSDLLAAYESRSARRQDTAYVGQAACGCDPLKAAHSLNTVIPAIPTTSTQPAFLAQVRTTAPTASTAHRHAWYVVAVAQNARGRWKLAFVTLGGYGAAPPLQRFGDATGYTYHVNAWARSRMTTLAHDLVASAMSHNRSVSYTTDGATVHTRFELENRSDGLFGLSFSSGQVMSCFTVHLIETYTRPGGLRQDAMGRQWGSLLAPGAYRSIRVDTGTPECVIGKGVGRTHESGVFSYETEILSITGVSL